MGIVVAECGYSDFQSEKMDWKARKAGQTLFVEPVTSVDENEIYLE